MIKARDREPAHELPDLSVQSFAACQVGPNTRLIGAPVDSDTIYLVLAGKLHLALPSSSIVAEAGKIVLVPAGLQPSIASSGETAREYQATRERLHQRGGLLVFDAAGGAGGPLQIMVGRVHGDLRAALNAAKGETIVADLKSLPLAKTAYAALRAELANPSPGLPVLAATLMKACLLLFVRTVRSPRTKAPRGDAANRIATVAATIRARPGEPYSIDALATLAGMSRATFARQFLRHVGATPMEFVLQVRLRDAAGLLTSTSLSIKQVASDAGFQSRSHFSRAFQSYFGADPSRYRSTALGQNLDGGERSVPILQPPGA